MTQLTSGIQMDLVQIAHDYGWAAVALVVMVDRVAPFFAQKMFPQFQKSQQAKFDAEKEEREFRHAMAIRQADSYDKLVETCQEIKEFMGSVNDRLGNIEDQLSGTRKPRKNPRKSRS